MLRRTYQWMSVTMRSLTAHTLPGNSAVWRTPVQVPEPVKDEWRAACVQLAGNQWTPIWRPPDPPDLTSRYITIVDASEQGWAYLQKVPGSRHYYVHQETWDPGTDPALIAEQYSRETLAMCLLITQHLQYQESDPTDPQHIRQLMHYIITDCQSIPRSYRRRYTSNDLFQQLMIDLDHQELMGQIAISWGPGDKSMPADDWSRFLRHDTTVHETAMFPDPTRYPGRNSVPIHTYVANTLTWWKDVLSSR
jgi:hypothetical protein